MKAQLEAVADSLENEVEGDWDVIRYDPIWRDPRRGTTVYIFGETDEPSGQYDTTGSREERGTIVIEYVAPAADQLRKASQGKLERDQAKELDLYDIGDQFLAWALEHTKSAFPPAITRFEHVATVYPSALSRELGVRYIRVTCQAFWDEVYPVG